MHSFLPVPDPVAFSIGKIDIMWYAICLTTGICAGALLMYFRAEKFGLNKDFMLDVFIWCVPIGLLCARLYYVAFRWEYYSAHLSQILNTRGGGLAIHGALIGGIVTGIILFKKTGQPTLKWLDLAGTAFPLAQAIGRWGNYFNSEAHGVATTLPWAIYADGEYVHPTFLYESIWCALLCIGLIIYTNKGKTKFDGQIILLYGMIYSAERFFVEGLRTDSLMIGNFRQAQVFSLATIAACLAAYVILGKRAKDNTSETSEIQ